MMKAIVGNDGVINNSAPKNTEYTAVFCTESEKSLMTWLMNKISLQVSKMPEMQRNGSWGSEMFYYTDPKFYQVINNGKIFFKIVFNLYNALRSTSSMVYATIFMSKESPVLLDMDFINSESMTDFIDTYNGVITGHNTNSTFESIGGGMGIIMPEPLGFPNTREGQKQWESNYKKNPNDVDWHYMNTLNVQKFNKDGFYSNDPSENVVIEGGIPESIRDQLRNGNCKDTNLMPCVVPGMIGVLEDGSASPIDGTVKNVYDGIQMFSDRKVETLTDFVYV
jgi:hypothetical protein